MKQWKKWEMALLLGLCAALIWGAWRLSGRTHCPENDPPARDANSDATLIRR